MPDPYRVAEDSVAAEARLCGRSRAPPLRRGGRFKRGRGKVVRAHTQVSPYVQRQNFCITQCCPYNGNPPIHSVYWERKRPILKGLGVFL